jgi:hypothetical protein
LCGNVFGSQVFVVFWDEVDQKRQRKVGLQNRVYDILCGGAHGLAWDFGNQLGAASAFQQW